jgi:hypothetical protein
VKVARPFTARTCSGHLGDAGEVFTAAMPSNPRSVHRAGALAAILALGLALSACVAAPDGAAPEGSAPEGSLPAPGRTIEASPPAAADLSDYRIAVVVPDASEESQTLLDATREFAATSGADLVEFSAAPAADAGNNPSDDPVGDALERAVGSDADVVLGLGGGVVDVFDFETGKILDQEFLVIGGQLAEPTVNVTAVIWPGATAREPTEEESVTVPRAIEALGAGVESIRGGTSGIVLHLD